MLTVCKCYRSLGDNGCIQFWQSSEPSVQGSRKIMPNVMNQNIYLGVCSGKIIKVVKVKISKC